MQEQQKSYQQAKLERFQRNCLAIQVMVQVYARAAMQPENPAPQPTKEESDSIRQFSGWGGFKFLDTKPTKDPNDPKEEPIRFPCRREQDINHPTWSEYKDYFKPLLEMKRALWEHVKRMQPDLSKEQQKNIYIDAVLDMGRAVKTAHYTPKQVVASIARALHHAQPLPIRNFCDPSAGLTVFNDEFTRVGHPGMRGTHIEMDYLTSQLAACIVAEGKPALRHGEVINAPYQQTMLDGQAKMDVIATNVPFHYSEKAEFGYNGRPALSVQDYFVYRAIDDVRDGGIVALIVPSSILDQDANFGIDRIATAAIGPNESRIPERSTIRDILTTKADCVAVARLPNDTFEGTISAADIIILQRNEQKRQQQLSQFEKDLLTLVPVHDETGKRHCLMKPLPLNPKDLYNHLRRGAKPPSEMIIGDSVQFKNWTRWTYAGQRVEMVDFVVRQSGGTDAIARQLEAVLTRQVNQRLDTTRYLANMSRQYAYLTRTPESLAAMPAKQQARSQQIQGKPHTVKSVRELLERVKDAAKEVQDAKPKKRRGFRL